MTAALTLATTIPALGLVGVASAPAQAAGLCAQSGLNTKCTFFYTGGPQNWTVPSGVTSATFTVYGAAGASTTWAGNPVIPGGLGGATIATINVTPGTTMRVFVGGRGDSSTGFGGWNGGGNGGGAGTLSHGSGGGGASDVRVAPYGLADRVLVGGGGGGAGWWLKKPGGSSNCGSNAGVPGTGGAGGGGGVAGGPQAGFQGLNSTGSCTAGGGGGGGASPGFGGGASGGTRRGLCGGSSTARAIPGDGGTSAVGGPGGYLVNSFSGARCDDAGGWGGGGGGGYSGAGGGGGGIFTGAGGGGGSGFGPAGSRFAAGVQAQDGLVQISYLNPSMSAWEDLGTSVSSDPAIAKRAGTTNTVDVFYLNAQGNSFQRTFTDGVPNAVDTPIGGVFYPGSSLTAVSWGPNRIDLFGRGTDSALWQNTFNGTSWGSWVKRTANGALNSNPTVASWGPGRLDVFWRGTSDTLEHLFSDDGTNWAWDSLGGTVQTAPAAVSWGPGRIDIFYGETQGGLTLARWRTYDAQNGGWQPETLLPGDQLTSAPSVSSAGPGTFDLYYRNSNNGLTSRSYSVSSGWSVWRDLGPVPSAAGSAPSVASLASGTDVVVIRNASTSSIGGRTFS